METYMRYTSRSTIQSLSRGLKLLDYVAASDSPVHLGELASFLDVEKSSAHRLMATLIAHGYVLQNSRKEYLPGPAIMELASKVGSRVKVHDIAGPFLSKLAQKSGETAHLGVLGRAEVILTNCVSSNHALAVTSRVGQAEPLYCTALGKALICQWDESKLKNLFAKSRLKKYTPKTITSFTRLKKECVKVKDDVLAKDGQEYRPGVRCLATPVMDFSGNIVASIGISGPASRLPDDYFHEVAQLVKRTGLELSKKLGFVRKANN